MSVQSVSKTSTLDVNAVRGDFPILQQSLPDGVPLVYLDTAATAQKPRAVIDKVTECYETCYANPHRGIHWLGDQVTVQLEAARETIQQFLGADRPEEILFTSGTTMSVNLVAQAWGRKSLQSGDRLLLTDMEHHANLVPWQQIARETGAELRFIPLTPDGRLDLTGLDKLLDERTRLLAVTSMSNVLGTINPVAELTARAHEQGALVFVDAAQSVPHARVNVREWGVDFLAFSGHKLYGPSGVGVLYGRHELLQRMDPFLYGGHMIEEVSRESSSWADPPARFEAGTMPVVGAIALGTAVEYLQRIGWDAIHSHEQRLLRRAHDRLAEIPGLRIYGPAVEQKGAIICFTVERLHAHDLADLLNRKGVAVRAGHHCAMPLHEQLGVAATTRASFGLYNTEAEVDALIDALAYARRKFRLA